MFPYVASNYVLRGVKQEPYLCDTRAYALIPLENGTIASIIRSCDGHTELSTLARRYRVDSADMSSFLGKFASIGAIEFSEDPVERKAAVAFGPKRPWLKEVHLDITNRCNMANSCRHCYRGEKLNKGRDRTTDEWLGLLSDLLKMGVYNLAFSGGEPFLRSDMPQLVRHVIDRRMLLGAIFTNGSLWNQSVEETVGLIAEKLIATTFYVSLDGPTVELHEGNRGQGSFAQTNKFIKRLIEFRRQTGANYRIAVNSQITSENVRMLLPWYHDMIRLGVDRWRITSGRVTGRLLQNIRLLPLWNELFSGYETLIQEHIRDRQAGAPLLLNVEGFFNTRMLDGKMALTFANDNRICDYKENACSIEPNGDVQFCTSWSDRTYGNVFSGDIANIWYGTELQSLKAMRVSEIVDCRGCEFLEYCGGGCRLVAKSLASKDHHSCERYNLYKTRILPILLAAGIRFTNERNEDHEPFD